MKHFNITDWADSVRGLAAPADQALMRAHLDSGCSRCSRIATALERVAQLARREPAENRHLVYAVRSANAYFSLNLPSRQNRLSEIALGLDFDSALSVAGNNIRSEAESPRQLAFASDEYTLDLTVDPAHGAGETGVAGYCLRREGDPVAGAPVFLICRGQFAGQDKTGEFGEFQFESELLDPMELWVFDDNDLPVAVSLNLAQAA